MRSNAAGTVQTSLLVAVIVLAAVVSLVLAHTPEERAPGVLALLIVAVTAVVRASVRAYARNRSRLDEVDTTIFVPDAASGPADGDAGSGHDGA